MNLVRRPKAGMARVQANIVLLMFGLSMMSYIDRTILSVASPTLIREFDLSETEMGALYSAFLLSYAVLMAPGGWLADRFGPRLVLALATSGAALFTGLTAAAGQGGLGLYLGVLPSFLAVRFAFGVCTAPLYPACGRMTAKWVSLGKRSQVQGLILSGAPLGAALTPVLSAWLIGRYGWRSSFFLPAAATAAIALVWFWYVRDSPSEHPGVAAAGNFVEFENRSQRMEKTQATSWTKLLANRNLILLTVGYFALGYFEYVFFYWIYYYFDRVRQMGSNQSAIYTTVLHLTMMVMMPLGGWVADRLVPHFGRNRARRIVAVAAMPFSAVLLYFGTSLGHPAAVVILLSLALGFAACAEGPFWASAIEAGGRDPGAAGGILNAGGNLGGLLAPILTPYIAARANWSWSLHIASLIVLAGAGAWLLMEQPRVASQEHRECGPPEGESVYGSADSSLRSE